jgi:hypothetical protein
MTAKLSDGVTKRESVLLAVQAAAYKSEQFVPSMVLQAEYRGQTDREDVTIQLMRTSYTAQSATSNVRFFADSTAEDNQYVSTTAHTTLLMRVHAAHGEASA